MEQFCPILALTYLKRKIETFLEELFVLNLIRNEVADSDGKHITKGTEEIIPYTLFEEKDVFNVLKK